MATYKVIQDIEAEDKLLGPLTLRQFIYGAVAALCGYFCFVGFAKHVYILLPVFLPIMLAAGFFAFPWGRDQPTEVWALAKVRFLLLPRRRIWDQSGAKELVTVTAPKKVDQNYTDGLSQTEVKSRLQALADTIDSRGWVIKNVDPTQVGIMGVQQSDRLIDVSGLPREVSADNLQPSDDIMDESSQTAEHFDQMINSAEARHRQELMQVMSGQRAPAAQTPPKPPENLWFLNQSASNQPDANVINPADTEEAIPPTNTAEEQALDEELKSRKKTPQVASSHLRTIQPPSAQTDTKPAEPPRASKSNIQDTNIDDNQAKNAKIEQSRRAVELAELANNNDRNIASIAREANKDDEVVINLH